MISHQTSLYDVNVTRGIVVAYIELQLHTTTDEKTRDGVHIQRERERICGKISSIERRKNKRFRAAGLFGIKKKSRETEGDGGGARALLQCRQHRAVTNRVVLHVYM